jgi:hypothetical protein
MTRYVYRAASGLSHIVEPDAVTTSCGRDLDASEVAVPIVQGDICQSCVAFDLAREPVHVSSLLDDFFSKAPCKADEALDSLGSLTAADEKAVA